MMVKSKIKPVGRPSKMSTMYQTKEIAEMLLACKSRKEIIEYCVKTYGVAEASVSTIVTRAYKYIKEAYSANQEGLVETHVQMYYDIYTQCKLINDSRGAIQALNSIEKLLRLLQPETAIQNNSINLDLSKLSIEDLRSLISHKST